MLEHTRHGAADSDLFGELTKALHEESAALIANDPARLYAAASRRQHLLRMLAPQGGTLLPGLQSRNS